MDDRWGERKNELIAALSSLAVVQEIEVSLDIEQARELLRAELARMREGAYDHL